MEANMKRQAVKEIATRRAEAKIAELLRRGVKLSKSDVRAIRSGEKHMVEMEAAGTPQRPWSPQDVRIERPAGGQCRLHSVN
jgi:hypothetical protein